MFASCFCNFLMFVTLYAISACLCVYSNSMQILASFPGLEVGNSLGTRLAMQIQYNDTCVYFVIMFTACMWFQAIYSAIEVQNKFFPCMDHQECTYMVTSSSLRQQNNVRLSHVNDVITCAHVCQILVLMKLTHAINSSLTSDIQVKILM